MTSLATLPPSVSPQAETIATALRCIEDPCFFVREIIGAEPEVYQEKILWSMLNSVYSAAHCGHGVGKTTVGSWGLLWWLFTRPNSKVITTAPTWRQVKDLLWTEVHHWVRKAKLEKMGWYWPYRLLDTRLEIADEWFATGEASDDPTKLEGYHAPHIMYLIDEAKGVPDSHFNSMDGGMTTDARMVLLSTPGDTAGKFYNVCSGKEDKEKELEDPTRWNVIWVNGEDSNRVSKQWILGRRKAWGASSALYRIRVQGLFTDTTTDTLIPAGWYEECLDWDPPVKSRRKARPMRVMAVDVARYGGDSTIVGFREGSKVLSFQKMDRQSLEKTAERVYIEAKAFDPDVLLVDEVGVGAGVLDNLQSGRRRLTRSRVVGFNGARKPDDVELYYNRRAEVYWRLRELFAKRELSVPPDELLGQQLTEMKYQYVPKGEHTVLKIQSKEEMRKQGKSSPDEADTLAMLFAEDEISRSAGIGVWI